MNQTRKILLCVSGMSPQIVTETLYALVTEKNWIPDEIRVLSTKEGCDRAKAELLHESRNMFGKFCDDYLPQGPRPRFDENSFVTFSRSSEPSGNPVALNDIVDLEDSAQVADTIAKEVFELTKDENTEIHASIAGGRKSMGFLLGYAMSLYGRPQDRLLARGTERRRLAQGRRELSVVEQDAIDAPGGNSEQCVGDPVHIGRL